MLKLVLVLMMSVRTIANIARDDHDWRNVFAALSVPRIYESFIGDDNLEIG